MHGRTMGAVEQQNLSKKNQANVVIINILRTKFKLMCILKE